MVKYIRVIIVGLLFLFGINTLKLDNTFDSHRIYYDNVHYSDNVDFYGVEGTYLNYSGSLSYVGDYYELYFDVVNDTGVDVVICDYFLQEDNPYIHYELTYEDGNSIHNGDLLKKNESKTIHYKVLYQKPIEDDQYELDTNFSINFEQNI